MGCQILGCTASRYHYKIVLNLTDRSGENLIYCFKTGTPCASGAELQKQQLLLMNNQFENIAGDKREIILVDQDIEDDFIDILYIVYYYVVLSF